MEDLRRQYRAIPPGAEVRLAKRTSNLFRDRHPARRRDRRPTGRLDMSGFAGVIDVDRETATAEVGGTTTYEDLVDVTLAHGLVPLVVPQLRTITVGGAVTGLGIESSSWRNGMPHESVVEMDVLTGDGRVVVARADNEHRDLFFGFPNSYGTLGYALRLRIELEPARRYVHLRHLRCHSAAEAAEVVAELCRPAGDEPASHGGEAVHFVDGTVFGPDECYLSVGSWAAAAPRLSDYTYTDIYYRSVARKGEDWLTARDYLWRWDTDWFWCSRAFGVQRPWARRLAGRRLLRSDVYWRLAALERRYHLKAAVDRRRGLPEREDVVQDVEVPVEHLAELVAGLRREVPIWPLWLCPLRQRDPSLRWDLYPLDPARLYVNVGMWSSVALEPGMDPVHHNRWVESEVDRLGGRKSLYSTASYDRDHFWQLYNGAAYEKLKDRYDPGDRLADLYAKCVGSR
ncbi:MAG: FAD-binding protein [Acidimicrobiales bacterium]